MASKTPACVLDTCRVTGRRALLRDAAAAGLLPHELRRRLRAVWELQRMHRGVIALGVEGFIPASPTESSYRFTLVFLL